MVRKTLVELYAQHETKVSDKWSLYLTEYERIFSAYRNEPIRMLEIGVQNGGSLEIWALFFEKAKKIIGCDINQDCSCLEYENSNIEVVVGNVNDESTQTKIMEHATEFDIVIDDGSHFSGDIVKSFATFFPRIVEGGVYVAEDLHCSYWQEFEGGLYDPLSSINFFKLLSDIVNHEHWGVDKKRKEILSGFVDQYGIELDEEVLKQVHSVEFINSICVVKKRPIQSVVLGARFIAGKIEHVIKGHDEIHSETSVALNQNHNHWSCCSLSPSEELPIRMKELSDRDDLIDELKNKINTHQHAIDSLIKSTSWRITAPLRWPKLTWRKFKGIARSVIRLVKQGGGVRNVLVKVINIYRHEGISGIKRMLLAIQGNQGSNSKTDYPEWVQKYDTLTDKKRRIIKQRIESLEQKPLISIIMPVFNPKLSWLKQVIESVQNQLYTNWELCIADDLSTDTKIRPLLEEFAKNDSRIKVVFREKNGHISLASNSALRLARGDWIALLDHDDLLSEHALFWVADAINSRPDVCMIYSDEDKIDEDNNRHTPYFKCDWNPDLFYSHNMFCHLGVYRRELVEQVGSFRQGLEGAQDYDLALRCFEKVKTSQIYHIPRILYHWRAHENSTSQTSDSKPYALLAGERAINEHFERMNIDAKAEISGIAYRVRYALPKELPLVSLIIPTRNGLELIRQCIDSILSKTSYPNYEIIIVDNGSDDVEVLDYFKSLLDEPRVKIYKDDRAFNYSQLNNSAVELVKGEIIGLINNDIEVISSEWLTEMVSHALRPEVGAVGAKLLYSDDTLQHGGVVLGIGGVAGHSHKHWPKESYGYFSRMKLISGFSAVTAACLLIKKATYKQVGGLNEADLKVAFNDVDFCLRVREAGYQNIWTPYAELYHHESMTRGLEDTLNKQMRFSREVMYMKETWGERLQCDPAYSPNLTLENENFSYSWPPRIDLID